MDEATLGAAAPLATDSQPSPEDAARARLAALEAEHGRVCRVCAGEGAERVEFALKMPDAKEWATIALDAEKSNPDLAEQALRRAVVGLGADETKAERKRMEAVLDADPMLADYWGPALLMRCGWQAPITCEPGAAPDTFVLIAEVDGEIVKIASRKLSRAQNKVLRGVAVKSGVTAYRMGAWTALCGDETTRTTIAEKYPALPAAFGSAAMEAGSKVKGAGPFV